MNGNRLGVVLMEKRPFWRDLGVWEGADSRKEGCLEELGVGDPWEQTQSSQIHRGKVQPKSQLLEAQEIRDCWGWEEQIFLGG